MFSATEYRFFNQPHARYIQMESQTEKRELAPVHSSRACPGSAVFLQEKGTSGNALIRKENPD